jgi:hypothetical protein
VGLPGDMHVSQLTVSMFSHNVLPHHWLECLNNLFAFPFRSAESPCNSARGSSGAHMGVSDYCIHSGPIATGSAR